jgi:hypothetical protein
VIRTLAIVGGALGAAALVEHSRAPKKPTLPTCKNAAEEYASAVMVGAGQPATCIRSPFAGAEASGETSSGSSSETKWYQPLLGVWGALDPDPRTLFGALGGADELAEGAGDAADRVVRAVKTLAIVAGLGVAAYVAWGVVTR